jgi:hypothetical protein
VLQKILHFVWIGSNTMPDWAEKNIAEFKRLNPAYQVMIHGEEVLLDEIQGKYNQISFITSKSDLLRYSALKKFGGWYFDCDFWPMRSIDDIQSAYGLTGSKLFISKQNGQKNSQLKYANGILAAGKDSKALDSIIDYVLNTNELARVSYGPGMLNRLVEQSPSEFVIADWPWFFPADIQTAVGNYLRILNGYDQIAHTMAPTGGQKPFAMHLWANGKTDLKEQFDSKIYFSFNPEGKKLAGILASDIQVKNMRLNPDHPLKAAADGLAKIGYRVEVRPTGYWPLWFEKPDIIIVWNGMRSEFAGTVAKARAEGIKVLQMEHGFYDRSRYFQADHKGILHWASWTGNLAAEITENTEIKRKRFEKVWPAGIKPIRYKKDGYILVLGQVSEDTQMLESEIRSGLQLDHAVYNAIKDLKITAFFRAHPKDAKAYFGRRKYLPESTHQSLAEAAAGAKFVIAINSNSCVECLAMGVPVMAFGPATFLQAGVAQKTSLQTLRNDIIQAWQKMDLPEQEKINNYLYTLAAKQYSLDELREGSIFNRGLSRIYAD